MMAGLSTMKGSSMSMGPGIGNMPNKNTSVRINAWSPAPASLDSPLVSQDGLSELIINDTFEVILEETAITSRDIWNPAEEMKMSQLTLSGSLSEDEDEGPTVQESHITKKIKEIASS